MKRILARVGVLPRRTLLHVAAWLPLIVAGPSSLHAQKLEFVKELTVGVPDGPPEYAFGRVEFLAATSRQTFFIFDVSDTQIRRYDNQGHFHGLVGRSGAGPGEYREIAGMAMFGDSLLLVYDQGNHRIAIFDSAGKYRTQISLTRISLFYGDDPFVVSRSGLIAIRVAPKSGEQEGTTVASQYVRMRLDGSIADSISMPSAATQGTQFVLITADGERWSFPDQTVFALLADGGVISARTTAYRVSVAPRQGQAFVIQRPDQPIRIDGEERTEWEAYVHYFANRIPGRAVSIPPIKPLIRDLRTDDAGRIWVHRYVPGVKRAIPPRPAGDPRPLLTVREVNAYDVFDPKGMFMGSVALPPNAMLMAIRGDRIYVRQEAGAGEYLVERYALRGLPRS